MTNAYPCRMPPVSPVAYSPEQKQAHEEFYATRGKHLGGAPQAGAFAGPWGIFIRSPELLTLTQRMGEYLRYRCAISGRLSELAILLVARHWSADFEWYAHSKIAVKEGLSQDVVDAIAEGRRPDGLKEDEQIVYDYVSEILTTRRVSDMTFERAKALFGEKALVDICGVTGYYSLLAMTMNVARVQTPDGSRMSRLPE
ncbi:MAG: carboxymuconolactone decarboxylase family protein [Beijerinckiaceae bacterium]